MGLRHPLEILCEKIPFNITIFNKNNFCTIKAESCNYCRKINEDRYACSKNTYENILELSENTQS